MDISIRKGIKKDLPQVFALIKELAEYENALQEVTITLDELENDGFSNQPLFQFLIAEKENELVGLSFYYIRYSTWKGKFLYLEDFVVKESFRGNSIGTLLFEETIKICKSEKYQGMTWQVLDWNTPAINFYKKYNSEISSTWLNGKLTKEQIHKLCNEKLNK
tara:strand:+ start:186 stop:674 length:489 start_codon:yes stop_codon:yes gene_type:complete